MRIKFAPALAGLFCALTLAGRAFGAAELPPAPTGAAARSASLIEPRYYTLGDFGGVMDARQFWAQCTMSATSQVLTCGTTTTVSPASVTAAIGERTITASSGSFSGTLAGQYFTATGLGPSGATFSSLVLAALGSTQIEVQDPVQTAVSAASNVTFTFNSIFNTATDPNKTIYIGMPGIYNIGSSSSVPYVATISSCSSVNSCTLSVPATTAIPANANGWVLITIGTDDSAACTSAVTAALARGDRFIGVPASSLVPSCTKGLELVIPKGEGQLYFPPVRRFVAPLDAGAAPPPQSLVQPQLHFTNTAAQIAAKGTATCVVTGDSLNMFFPAISQVAQTLPAAVFRRMDLLSPNVKMYERGVGGYSEINFDSSAGIGSNDTIWATNTSTSWLGSPSNTTGYIYSLAPSCMFIGFGNNDAQQTYTPLHIYDYVANIKSWTPPVDILFSTSWPKDLATASGTQDQYDSVTMFRRTFAEVNGFGLLDFNRTAVIARDGYDPARPAMSIFPWMNLIASLNYFALGGNTFSWPVATTGYSEELYISATAPTFFTAAVNTSANGVGEVIWEVGCNLTTGNTCGDNVARVGIDNTAQGGGNTGNAYLECDPDYLHPGAGCRIPTGNANLLPGQTAGAVPVTYSQTATCSMTAASNSLTCTTAQFTSADEGNPIVVAGVGAAMGNGFKDYLLCNAHYVSATNITCFTNSGHGTAANATTTISAVSMQIGRGNPHIVSGWAITGATANPFYLGLTVNGDYFNIWFQDPNQQFGPQHIIRFGGNFQPKMWWTGTAGSSGSLMYFPNGGYQFVETPQSKMFAPTLTSWEVNGNGTWTGDPAADPVSSYSGAADNHPTTLFGATVINPVVDAQNLCVTCQPGPAAAGASVPTTGATVTIPVNQAFTAINPAGTLAALTVTLPNTFPQGQTVRFAISQAITALTVSAPSGDTIAGAGISGASSAANASYAYVLEGTVFYRVQ